MVKKKVPDWLTSSLWSTTPSSDDDQSHCYASKPSPIATFAGYDVLPQSSRNESLPSPKFKIQTLAMKITVMAFLHFVYLIVFIVTDENFLIFLAERRRKVGLPPEDTSAAKSSAPVVEEKKSFLPIMPATKVEQMRECLRSLKQNHKERIGAMRGRIEFLELCGFEKQQGGEFLILPTDKVDRVVLNSGVFVTPDRPGEDKSQSQSGVWEAKWENGTTYPRLLNLSPSRRTDLTHRNTWVTFVPALFEAALILPLEGVSCQTVLRGSSISCWTVLLVSPI
ncbi:hypothetical protein FEM48_Zijuj07G0063700 [Ziziphus jujuba var. spinosa]|uniref:Uncharacterized protein n=1 Tax=Ziziphus jujuba var. spinosa TaxID=714518 RepID=A0A978V2Z8_ZIZJJ|nr:hypothetical protein FEM48_Zijuj07G0063700 [Ziziphus jujuba var. spinosa]